MTTAHKATFHPAVGRADPGGYRFSGAGRLQYSSRDIAAQTKLKFRQFGQNSVEEIAHRDLKAELEQREQMHIETVDVEKRRLGLLEAPVDESVVWDDADDSAGSSSDDESGDNESEDDDDEEAELLRELAKIKEEREAEAERKARENAQLDEDERKRAVLDANPLMRLSGTTDSGFSVKRRWDDDVVFRNRAEDEPNKKKRFVNDTIRNDFHVKFLHRYIK